MVILNKKAFDSKLQKLNTTIDSILAHKYTVGKSNVTELTKLMAQYTKLSNEFDNYTLTAQQRRELSSARALYPRSTRSELNRKIKAVNEVQVQQTKKIIAENELRQKKVAEARTTVTRLFPEVREAAEKCLKANTTNIDHYRNLYKSLAAQLRQAIELLDSSDRLDQIQQLSFLSQSVNQHSAKIDDQDRKNCHIIRNAVRQAREKVSGGTFEGLLQTLIGRENASKLLEHLAIDPHKLIKNEKIGKDEGRMALTEGATSNPEALLRSLVSQLQNSSSSTEHSAALLPFIKAIEKNFEDLVTGKKTHLSILFEDKGVVGSVHIDIQGFTTNTVELLFFNLYKLGVGIGANVVMSITSITEVNALLRLNDLQLSALPQPGTLQELVGHVIQYAGNPKVLAAIPMTSSENMREVTLTPNRKGLEASQVLNFIETMATLIETKHLLVSMPEMNKDDLHLISDTHDAGLKGRIRYVHVESKSDITTAPEKTAHGTMFKPKKSVLPIRIIIDSSEKQELDNGCSFKTVEVDGHQKLKTKTPVKAPINLSNEYRHFNESLLALAEIYNKLAEKGRYGNKKYKETAEFVLSAYMNIKDSGDSFFKKPGCLSLEQFVDVTIRQIKDIEPVLKQHRGNSFGRGILAVLNGILGIIAVLTLIPALIIEASSEKGFAGTFFSPPETNSARALQSVKRSLIGQGIAIESKLHESSDDLYSFCNYP